MKQQAKLLTAVLLLVTAVVMVVSTSYAWLTISNNPVAQGIQIAVAGSHTILVAPDMTYAQDGRVYHYPGTFAENLNFGQHDQYAYLQDAAGLTPVSTADGMTWYLPTYYQKGDAAVQAGQAIAGELRPTTEFQPDRYLAYANIPADQEEDVQQGSYLYLDFWVVSPADGYKLRVSTGAEGNGSYAIDLLQPEAVTAEDGQVTYALTKENALASASMRVGFLINEDTAADESMRQYMQSPGFNESYHCLQGVYSEPGMGRVNVRPNRFTIYEPNGDRHPVSVVDKNGSLITDGQYSITDPLGAGGRPTSVQDRLSVQLANRWHTADNETMIAQIFRTFIAGKNLTGETAQTLKNEFYTDWLQYQLYPYITKGSFITRTADLYTAAGYSGVVQEQDAAVLDRSGATDDVHMTTLEAGVPQRIRMFIWLEGQDVDCINAATTGSFALSVELAGSNAS